MHAESDKQNYPRQVILFILTTSAPSENASHAKQRSFACSLARANKKYMHSRARALCYLPTTTRATTCVITYPRRFEITRQLLNKPPVSLSLSFALVYDVLDHRFTRPPSLDEAGGARGMDERKNSFRSKRKQRRGLLSGAVGISCILHLIKLCARPARAQREPGESGAQSNE